MTGTDLSLRNAADKLGVHYMTAYRYVRTGRLPAVQVAGEWRVSEQDVEALRQKPAHARGRGGPRSDYLGRLTSRLVEGDEAGAWAVVESALAAGLPLEDAYLKLLSPAMHAIGDGWQSASLTVADEHLASAVTSRLVGRLGPRMRKRGRTRGTVVLGAPSTDPHSLPVAMLADLLRGRGFAVIDLGADVPGESFAEAIASAQRLVAVAIGCSTSGNERNVRRAIRAIRDVTDAPVLAGGGAIEGDEPAHRLGADGWSGTGADTLEIIEALARANHPKGSGSSQA